MKTPLSRGTMTMAESRVEVLSVLMVIAKVDGAGRISRVEVLLLIAVISEVFGARPPSKSALTRSSRYSAGFVLSGIG